MSKAADTSKAKSKKFRVAVEGATTDGREITREWITQMAANYSATKYGARVNLEHIRGILPDSQFKAYGDVLELEAQELSGEFSGKLGLFATIAPLPELVALTDAKQKIYTSIEVDPNFAKTGEAYMVGLAVTDSPASLGTEILAFAAQNPAASPFTHKKQNPHNLFTAAVETVIELEPAAAPGAVAKLFSSVQELLAGGAKKTASDEARFTDINQAVTLLATHGKEQADAFAQATATITTLNDQVATLTADREKDRKEFSDLVAKLSKQDGGQAHRPAATGGSGEATTDC
jgi:uncharacterized coiled-coil protein SlyX